MSVSKRPMFCSPNKMMGGPNSAGRIVDGDVERDVADRLAYVYSVENGGDEFDITELK